MLKLSRPFLQKHYVVIFVLAFALLANFWVYSRASQEQYIHYWDSVGYWKLYYHLGDIVNRLRETPEVSISQFVYSIRHFDYTVLPVLILAPFYILLGGGRAAFIHAILNLFILPAYIIYLVLVIFIGRRFFSAGRPTPFSTLFLATLLFSFFPLTWIAVLWGDTGSFGMIFIFFFYYSHLRKRLFSRPLPILFSYALGFVFLLAIRRWYLLWIASFFVTLGLEWAFDWFRGAGTAGEPRNATSIKIMGLMRILFFCLVFLLLFALFLTPLFSKALFYDFERIYAPWGSGSFWVNFSSSISRLGPSILGLFLLGLLFCLGNRRVRLVAISLTVQILIVLILISRVQVAGKQHYVLIIPAFVLVCLLGLNALVERYGEMGWARSVASAMAFVFPVNFLACFSAPVEPPSWIRVLVIEDQESIPTRHDIDEIEALVSYLERSDVEHVYVLSSSHQLNSSILKESCFQLKKLSNRGCAKIVESFSADLRDGFPYQFFLADSVMVAEPIQLHLPYEAQHVVHFLAKQFLSGEGIASSYRGEQLPFKIEGVERLYLYRKVSNYSEEDLAEVDDYFRQKYPEAFEEKFSLRNFCVIYRHLAESENFWEFGCREESHT